MIRAVSNIQRNRPPWLAIESTKRIKYGYHNLIATMPFGNGPEDVVLHYFKPRRMILDPEELAAEFESLDLMPDLQAQIADNEQDPTFADKYKNAMQWNLKGKVATYLAFRKVMTGRAAECRRRGGGWGPGWWFAGVLIHPKSPIPF
jgi:hypothetical protein